MDTNTPMGQSCPCPHHKMVPVYVVLLGVLFLLNAFDVVTAGVTAMVWPIIIIAIGLQKIFQSRCSCCSKDK